MANLLKDPATALKELRAFQRELQALQTKYIFSDVSDADQDNDTNMIAALHTAEKASMALLDKLIAVNEQKHGLGCKVKGIGNAA